MEESGIIRDESGKFIPGVSGNPSGRTPETLEKKALRKATKDIIAEYKQALTEALPMIQPIIIAKAMEGDMTAVKEIHDRTMDKAKQATDITTNGRDLPTPILGIIKDVSTNNSTTEDSESE